MYELQIREKYICIYAGSGEFPIRWCEVLAWHLSIYHSDIIQLTSMSNYSNTYSLCDYLDDFDGGEIVHGLTNDRNRQWRCIIEHTTNEEQQSHGNRRV